MRIHDARGICSDVLATNTTAAEGSWMRSKHVRVRVKRLCRDIHSKKWRLCMTRLPMPPGRTL